MSWNKFDTEDIESYGLTTQKPLRSRTFHYIKHPNLTAKTYRLYKQMNQGQFGSLLFHNENLISIPPILKVKL